jgi:hypothetical protein
MRDLLAHQGGGKLKIIILSQNFSMVTWSLKFLGIGVLDEYSGMDFDVMRMKCSKIMREF